MGLWGGQDTKIAIWRDDGQAHGGMHQLTPWSIGQSRVLGGRRRHGAGTRSRRWEKHQVLRDGQSSVLAISMFRVGVGSLFLDGVGYIGRETMMMRWDERGVRAMDAPAWTNGGSPSSPQLAIKVLQPPRGHQGAPLACGQKRLPAWGRHFWPMEDPTIPDTPISRALSCLGSRGHQGAPRV